MKLAERIFNKLKLLAVYWFCEKVFQSLSEIFKIDPNTIFIGHFRTPLLLLASRSPISNLYSPLLPLPSLNRAPECLH